LILEEKGASDDVFYRTSLLILARLSPFFFKGDLPGNNSQTLHSPESLIDKIAVAC
jgi:hypothetical protein